jgi:hypothetical protein
MNISDIIRNLSESTRRWAFFALLVISVSIVSSVWAWQVGGLLSPTSVAVQTESTQSVDRVAISPSSGLARQHFSFMDSVSGLSANILDSFLSLFKQY